jgi:hypothetical protein
MKRSVVSLRFASTKNVQWVQVQPSDFDRRGIDAGRLISLDWTASCLSSHELSGADISAANETNCIVFSGVNVIAKCETDEKKKKFLVWNERR